MIRWNIWNFNFPSSFIMQCVWSMHDHVIIFIMSVMLIVLLNLVYLIYSRSFAINFYEDHQLERVWTVVPFVLLIFIAFPSLLTLYVLDSCFFCGVTVGVTGHQWYWRYFYKDLLDFEFDSYMLPVDRRAIRLLDVDNRLILPRGTPLRFLLTSADVLHSWALPCAGAKIDAVPGRINQFCLSLKRTGVFFGQCSEICGANHRFIPIVVESVPLFHLLK